jgi:hypothetical protein
MPSLANRYPLAPAFARQVDGCFTSIMWVSLNGEFSQNLAGESNGIAILMSMSQRWLHDRSPADPGKIVALGLIRHCGTGR